MTSLLRMSDEELAKAEAGSGFRIGPALGVSSASSVLALTGMLLRYSPGDDVPIAGMDHLSGQLLLAIGLGAGMMAGAYLVRSLFMKRLQWAVLFSLLLHLFLCVALQVVVVDVPLALAAEIGDSELPPRDITMPDYGGTETESEQQQWEHSAEIDLPESEQRELERQQTEIEIDSQIAPVELQRQVTEAVVPERQQQQLEQMEAERRLEIERQQRELQQDQPRQLEAPEVQTADAREADLEAREMERSEADPSNSQRQMERLETSNELQLSAASIAPRAEVRPEDDLQVDVELRQRQAAEARMADTMAEPVAIASASEARQITAESRSTEIARSSQADLSSETRPDSPELSTSREMHVQSVTPTRITSPTGADATPSGGADVAIQRSTSDSGSNTSAASASAQAVNVAAVSEASAASLNASEAASNVARGQSSAPATSARGGGGGGSPSVTATPFGVAALQSGTIGRGQGSQSGPQLGDAAAADVAVTGTGRNSSQGIAASSAAGSRAAEVSVGAAAAGNDATERLMASGPASAASNVSRSGQGLPAGTGSRPGNAAAQSGGTGSELTIAMNTNGLRGLSGRGNRPSAELGNSPVSGGSLIGAEKGRSGTGRRMSAATSLPEGALRAEQSGALVIAGPQATGGGSAGSGNLNGPRSMSLSRRSAGLPGAERTSVAAASRRSPAGGLSPRKLPGRQRSAEARPKLATDDEVAALIRRAVPGISAVPTERISAGFSMRTPEARKEAVGKLGGNDASEAAVDRGLEWLAAHQYAAGNWSIHDPNCKDHNCNGAGIYEADPAATGLALLAFLGAGNTHKVGGYQQEVQLGLDWLLQNQNSEGDLFAAESQFARFYSHGMAAIALCEAFGMTKDDKLKGPAQKAIDFIVASQHPEFGGWRYEAQFESDTSVSGWQLMALKSAEMAGLNVPKSAYAGVGKWLDSVEDAGSPGRFAYHPTKEVTDSMTAEGLLMRQYLGADRRDSDLQAGASYLQSRPPRSDARDVYHWYYATQVMFHMQGDHWNSWNAALRDMLVESQEKAGVVRGSWDPESPTKDKWGQSGGRHYVTCLNLLMLEVYYRHLPLYIELDQ